MNPVRQKKQAVWNSQNMFSFSCFEASSTTHASLPLRDSGHNSRGQPAATMIIRSRRHDPYPPSAGPSWPPRGGDRRPGESQQKPSSHFIRQELKKMDCQSESMADLGEQPPAGPTYVYCRRPRCPCGSARLRSYRSLDNGDGSRTKYSRCLECGRRLVLVLE
jgi:hypothetical protein